MLVGSMDTPAAAIEWTLSELIKHPRVMKKVQKEAAKKMLEMGGGLSGLLGKM